MAIVEMKKMTLIALMSEKAKIINGLCEFGVLHIIEITENRSDDIENHLEKMPSAERLKILEKDLNQVTYVLEGIKRFSGSKKRRLAVKPRVSPLTYREILNNHEQLQEIHKQFVEVEAALGAINNKIAANSNLMTLLIPWKSLEEPLENLKDTKNTIVSTGTVAKRYASAFHQAVEGSGTGILVSVVCSDDAFEYLLLIGSRDSEKPLADIQKQYGFAKSAFDNLTGSAEENLERLQSELAALEIEKGNCQLKGSEMAAQQAYLERLYDILTVESDTCSVNNHFLKSSKTFVLSAWVPIELVGELELRLKKMTEIFSLSFVTPEPEEVAPTLLKNHRYAKPLEFITEQYSVPASKGIDPNAVMAPFFISFFGIMISDAVYGVLIALISILIMKKIHPTGNFKKILGIMILGGISASFWGVLFGGWFGGSISIAPVLFNPLQDPFKMIALCIALGILHLFVGIGMQAYLNIKRGFILDALLDQGLWILFILSIMSLWLPAFAPYNQFAAATFAIGMVLTQGRKKKNLVMKLLSGILSLYRITGFLGDVLSYLRLFALGLTTGVIGTVINSMALMLYGSLPGNILMVLILIIGHTFNIGINVLGAYVHSSRLQYVEFFGKFYEGDGISYNPFRIKTKYVTIDAIDEEAIK